MIKGCHSSHAIIVSENFLPVLVPNANNYFWLDNLEKKSVFFVTFPMAD
jgi:hypothetical protein